MAEILGKPFALTEDMQQALRAANRQPGAVIAGIRPVNVRLEQGGIAARVEVSEMMGSELHLHMLAQNAEVIAVVPASGAGHRLTQTEFSFDARHIHLFDPTTEQSLLP